MNRTEDLKFMEEKGMIFSYATARSLVTAKKVTKGINAKLSVSQQELKHAFNGRGCGFVIFAFPVCLLVVKIGKDYLMGFNHWRKGWEIQEAVRYSRTASFVYPVCFG